MPIGRKSVKRLDGILVAPGLVVVELKVKSTRFVMQEKIIFRFSESV